MLMRLLLVLITILISTVTTNASSVGIITEQSGPTEIKRNKEVVPSAINSAVEMDDTITTANAVAGITFEDQTQVHITEQSKLVIDTFVYDPNKSTGKLAIKIALGTVKYTSGQIAKHNPQQVAVETPTATIGVRGTDFSSTVDELGRSTIVLLPSCPAGWKNLDKDCTVGSIVVSTDAGEIWLTKPFESTSVESREANPSKSAILDLSLNQINNMLIVSPPKGLKKVEVTKEDSKTALDTDLLSIDFLEYKELETDYLVTDRLSINFLDVNVFEDALSIQTSQFLQSELVEYNSLLPKYDKNTGLNYIVENDSVMLYRQNVNHYAEINVSTTSSLTYELTQDNINIKQIINSPGTTTIYINQSL